MKSLLAWNLDTREGTWSAVGGGVTGIGEDGCCQPPPEGGTFSSRRRNSSSCLGKTENISEIIMNTAALSFPSSYYTNLNWIDLPAPYDVSPWNLETCEATRSAVGGGLEVWWGRWLVPTAGDHRHRVAEDLSWRLGSPVGRSARLVAMALCRGRFWVSKPSA